MIASDIDEAALASAQTIVRSNENLKGKVELRHQTDAKRIFSGILSKGDQIDLVICNPPFHESAAAALKVSQRKNKNLHEKQSPKLNFGGKHNELWCEGGELSFIGMMIEESKSHHHQINLFSSLVSKEANLKPIKGMIKKGGAKFLQEIKMEFGNKKSRIILWSF